MSIIDFGRFDETRKRLLDEITSLSFEEVNKKPDSASWSVAQVCHHVSLAETSFAKAIRYGLKQDIAHDTESKPIYVLTDRTKKVEAPDIVKPGSEPLDVNQIVGMLNDSRTLLLDILHGIADPEVLLQRTVKHPLFGELPLNQWVEIVYLHEQRHIEQIQEIKTRIS